MGARQMCGKACSNCAADCTRPSQGYGDEFDDDRPGGDPAGATFEETLEDLNSLDRHLMLFCATSNLAAVRWLLHLGAHWDTCDANSTTCLHVACRAGTIAIVQHVMLQEQLIHAVDVAGWTALHIAVLMGRREVVVRLLQAGASLTKRNSKGQMPAELCADSGTYEAIRTFERHQVQSPGTPWVGEKQGTSNEDVVGRALQYEPFFVPRQAVVRAPQFKKELTRIGLVMFNRQPGFGLAFLVASGVARDYPVDMSTFLRRSKVDIRQVGNFLGEAFSLSHTIRLEFINSVVMQNTGVVGALIQVCQMLQLPDDLQKINRIVHGVARIWWRQHERMVKDLGGQLVPPGGATRLRAHALAPVTEVDELRGLELKRQLASSDTMHQLMFSAILLHWYVYKDAFSPRREMAFSVWQKIHAGIEPEASDVPEHVQFQVHAAVCNRFIKELAVATPSGRPQGGGPDEGGGHGPGDDPAEKPRSSVLHACAAIEGWAQMAGGGFPKPTGLQGVQTVTYRHVTSIFSEATTSTGTMKSSSVLGSPGKRGTTLEANPSAGPKRDDFAWLSLCFTLLFFAASPNADAAPYAFVELQKVSVQSIQPELRILTIVGTPDPSEQEGAAERQEPVGPCNEPVANAPPVVIVLLLPDGRWQELNIQKLELKFPSVPELNQWSSHLCAACQGNVVRPVSSTGAKPGAVEGLVAMPSDPATVCF